MESLAMRLKSGISTIIKVKKPLKSSSFNLYIIRKKRNPFILFSFINLPVRVQLILFAISGSAIILVILWFLFDQEKKGKFDCLYNFDDFYTIVLLSSQK
jgi:hypothetical protein